MAEAKKNILTYEGLQKLEAELEEINVKKLQQRLRKQESRETYQKMLNMMLQRMSREILKQELKK